MFKHHRRALLALPALALVLATAACSVAVSHQTNTGGGTGGQQADTPKMTVALISHAPVGGAFFDTIIKGAKDAAPRTTLTRTTPATAMPPSRPPSTIPPSTARSTASRRASRPRRPSTCDPKAVDAGIPVIAYNAGERDLQLTGDTGLPREPEVLAGEAVGEQLTKAGKKKALCVVEAQGEVQLEDRCAGPKKVFTTGRTEQIFADGLTRPATSRP